MLFFVNFRSKTDVFLKSSKQLSPFRHNVRKGRLMNRPTVMASFNAIMGQMTEMSLRKKPVTMMFLRLESPSGKRAKASHCG